MIKVLIVEDNQIAVNLIKAYIEKIDGFSIEGVCFDGASALEFIERKNVDLILVDVTMPVMNGFTLVKKLRENQNFVDVIFITAMSNIDAVKNAFKYGAIDYIVKPFSFGRFLCALQNYKVRYTMLNKSGSVNQYEIDKIINHEIDNNFNSLLPKGINQITLSEIIETLEKFENEFTIEDLLEIINMSKVALRNYMRFLTQQGIVTANIQRGSVGRPQYHYRVVSTTGK